MSQQSAFGLETSKGLIAKVILAVTGFAGSIIFARVLGPEVYGAFYVILAAANVIDNPITGLGMACQKRISEGDISSREVLGAGLLATALLGGVISVATVTIGPRFNFVSIENGYVYTGILFLGLISFKILQPMVAGMGDFGTSVFLDMLRSIFTLPLQLGLVFFGFGLAGMVYGLSLASVLTAPLALYVLNVRPAVPSKTTLRSLWTYSKFSIPNQFFGAAYGQIDILLLGALLGSSASGQYRIAMQLVIPGSFLAGVMSTGLFAEVSSLVSSGEDANKRITTNLAFASLFSIPIFFGALAMPKSLVVTVFGPEYRPAATLLIGLGIYQIIHTQTSQLSSVLMGQDRPNVLLYTTFLTVIVNLSLGIVLVNRIGIEGVVIATIVATGVRYLLIAHYSRQEANFDLGPGPLRQQFIAGSVMFVVVAVLHEWWPVQSWADLLILVTTGAVVYASVLMALSEVFLLTARSIVNDARNRYSR